MSLENEGIISFAEVDIIAGNEEILYFFPHVLIVERFLDTFNLVEGDIARVLRAIISSFKSTDKMLWPASTAGRSDDLEPFCIGEP